MFYPFYYKDPFVRDCIFELKERNSKDVARLFGKILSRWIVKKCIENKINIQHTPIYLVPIPQHISKTKEKGFCHTTTLACSIEKIITTLFPDMSISTFPCISKIKKTKRLHDSSGKQKRFVLIKNTMQTHITSQDAKHACFFIIDDVFTTGATFKEAGGGGF
jgi:predicted amidophosphoribosyltransferase